MRTNRQGHQRCGVGKDIDLEEVNIGDQNRDGRITLHGSSRWQVSWNRNTLSDGGQIACAGREQSAKQEGDGDIAANFGLIRYKIACVA
jgi:hypothetical protein